MSSAPIEAPRADRRKAESRQRLLAAARQLFTERGYHATRPQDIARAADVGHGTFYLHFADKQECFLAFAEAARHELEDFASRRVAMAHGPGAQLRALLDAVLEYAEQHPGVLRAAMTDLSVITNEEPGGNALVELWAAQWAEQIRAGAQLGLLRDDYDAEVIGHAIVGLIRSLGSVRRRLPRAVLVDNIARFLGRALAAEPGSKPAPPDVSMQRKTKR